MIKFIFLIIAILLSACSTNSHDRLYEKKSGFYSYIIGDLKSNRIYEEYAADVHTTPASCQKVITALLAVKTLGEHHRFKTSLYAEQEGNITKNAVISFSGDPTLTLDDLVTLLGALKGQRIKGKLFLDVTTYRAQPHSPNIMIHDIGSGYAQPVYSAIIDKNLINIKVIPTKIGNPALVKADSSYDIKSDVTTTAKESALQAMWDRGTIKVTGQINEQDKVVTLSRSPEFIESYIIHNKIAKAFENLNIKSRIEILDNKKQLPSNLTLLGIHESAPLKETFPSALKESDNLFFDSLYLTITNAQTEEPITDWAQGDPIIKDLLKKYYNLDFEQDLFVDGSGLSRLNRVRPRKLFELLKIGYSDEFAHALPRPKEEKGTLKNRYTLPESIRAKTGNLYGITCLCGYGLDKDRPKAFVIMASSFSPPNRQIHEIIDEFISVKIGKGKGSKIYK